MPDLSNVVTQAEFGALVGVSQRTVSELLSRGIIAEGEPAGAWLHAYCDHLRSVAAGRAAAGDLDLATERALLARAQRIRIETDNAIRAGELAPAYLLEQVLSKAGARVASIFDAIPGQIKRRVPVLPASAIDHIRTEIAKARNIAASVSLDDLKLDDDRDDDCADDQAIETTDPDSCSPAA